MKKLIILTFTLIILFGVFAGGNAPAFAHFENDGVLMSEEEFEFSTKIDAFNLVPNFVDDKYYISFPLQDMGIMHLCDFDGIFDFASALNIKPRIFKKNWQKVNLDIELQFFADDEENNFVFVTNADINACTWALGGVLGNGGKGVIEFYFNENYEWVFNDKTIYDLLQKENPKYRIVLRGENWHFRTVKQNIKWIQNAGLFSGDWATYEPNYIISSVALTNDPIDICGEVWKPTLPDNDGEVDFDEPAGEDFGIRFMRYFKSGFLSNAKAFNKVFSWGIVALGGLVVLTIISFLIKWIKLIF